MSLERVAQTVGRQFEAGSSVPIGDVVESFRNVYGYRQRARQGQAEMLSVVHHVSLRHMRQGPAHDHVFHTVAAAVP